jgi:hydroxysqualene dehydroxylase
VLRRHLWEPLCLAALNTPVERASAQLFANVLRDSLGSAHRADTDLLLPRVPFGELLPEPALRWLTKHGATVRFGQRVNTVHSTTVDGESFDAVILAVAPQHAAKLWPAMNTHFDYEPIATVYLQFSAKTALPFPLFNLLGKHGQWVVDRGNGLFACVISGHGEWEGLDDAALVDAVQNELKTVRTNGGPRIGEMAAWHKVIREKRATFCGRPQQSRPDHRTEDPRVFLAGDYTWADYPATLEGAVRSGLRAARAALQA